MLAVGRIDDKAMDQEATSRIKARNNHFSQKSLNRIMITSFPTSLALTGLRAFISLAWAKASVAFEPECSTTLALRVAVVALVTSTCCLLGIAVDRLRAPASDDDLSRTTVSAPDGFVWPCGVRDEVTDIGRRRVSWRSDVVTVSRTEKSSVRRTGFKNHELTRMSKRNNEETGKIIDTIERWYRGYGLPGHLEARLFGYIFIVSCWAASSEVAKLLLRYHTD